MARYRRVPRKIVDAPVVAAPEQNLDALLKGDLVALAQQRGLDTSGTKAELAARLKS